MFLQQFGEFQLQIQNLSVILVQLCLEFQVLIVETSVYGLGRVATLSLNELAMHVDQRTIGKETMRYLCQFAEVEPRLIYTVHQLRIGILLCEVPRLHEALKHQGDYFQQRLSISNQSYHVSHIGIDGKCACKLAILRGISIQLYKNSVFLSIEVSSAIDQGEVVGEELVRLADEGLQGVLNLCLECHLNQLQNVWIYIAVWKYAHHTRKYHTPKYSSYPIFPQPATINRTIFLTYLIHLRCVFSHNPCLWLFFTME